MTIQRQYSLPNCKLVLHGVSSGADTSGRPLLSTVTNVECYLAGQKVPLTGGRTFLDSLTTAVSDYAQSYLSGIHHLLRRDRRQTEGLVNLQQVGHNLHRMTVQPETGSAGTPTEVDLTTVQLFDLVEAVDQLYADGQTMPDLSLQLNPLSRRDVVAQEPLTKRATPAAIGLSGLAAAAALLFMLPVPEVRRPETAAEGTSTSQGSPTPSPAATGNSPAASPEAASPSPTASPTADSPTPASPTVASPAAGQPGVGADLANTSSITDPAELDRLTVQLYDQLNLAWRKTPTFDGELVYRVGVDSGGKIVGYKYSNDSALTYVTDTPLADVQFQSPAPEAGATGAASALAQFRVVFKSDGVLEVSPWDGQPDETAP